MSKKTEIQRWKTQTQFVTPIRLTLSQQTKNYWTGSFYTLNLKPYDDIIKGVAIAKYNTKINQSKAFLSDDCDVDFISNHWFTTTKHLNVSKKYIYFFLPLWLLKSWSKMYHNTQWHHYKMSNSKKDSLKEPNLITIWNPELNPPMTLQHWKSKHFAVWACSLWPKDNLL